MLDPGLPGRACLTVLREIRARRHTVTVLVLTGGTATEDVVRGLDVGANAYLIVHTELEAPVRRSRGAAAHSAPSSSR